MLLGIIDSQAKDTICLLMDFSWLAVPEGAEFGICKALVKMIRSCLNRRHKFKVQIICYQGLKFLGIFMSLIRISLSKF